MKINWGVLLTSFLIVFSVAFIGNLGNSGVTDGTYYQEIKPSITPPNYVFPIAWTILYILIALSIYFTFKNKKLKQKNKLVLLLGINLLLNMIWTHFYFAMKNPALAFVDIILLDISLIYLILTLRKTNKTSSYLLYPYLIWILFATILNFLSI